MSNIYITEDIKNYTKGIEILKKIKNYEIIKDEKTFIQMIRDMKLTNEEEKQYTLFTTKKGHFLKNYYLDDNLSKIKEEFYLSYENNCPFNCLYCYLRDYFNHSAFIFYVNLQDMFTELDKFNKSGTMISAGIVNDTLVHDSLTNVTSDLIEYFKDRPELILELRTKSHNIKNLLKITPHKNILISFTFSPKEVIDRYELGASSLSERIAAAKKLQEHGYSIGLRLDPMIDIQGSALAYQNMIKEIFSVLDLNKIRDIGIGTIRYKKGLRQKVLAERNTDLFFNEFIVGIDGKERYFKKIRIDMYKNVVTAIKKYGKFDIYLGMEPQYIWDEVFKREAR
ncbi:MAG: spore photoproduct lyase family protein [Psychrilyobacter sp.]|uniref:SPL family radical SAM protein n=1 Tax=Psychrilyobacter sp. TaxID=2586924 RepID=UPI003C79673B